MARRMDVTILEKMARRRGQKDGHLFERSGNWLGRYWVDSAGESDETGKPKRERICVTIAPSKGPQAIGKREARRIFRDEYLSVVNSANMRPSSAKTLGDFINSRFYPDYLPTLKQTGQVFYRSILKVHVLPTLGSTKLRDVTVERVQSLLTAKGNSGLSTQTVTHIRNCLSAVLRHAKAMGWLFGELPTGDGIRLKPMERKERRAPTWEQVCQLATTLPEPCSTLTLFLTLTGLRIGEATGLRWCHVNLSPNPVPMGNEILAPFSLAVRENYVLGKYTTLKTRTAIRNVPIPEWFVPRLACLLVAQGSPEALAPVFANTTGKAPIDQQHLLKRILKPAAARLGMGTPGHQVSRPGKGKEGPTRPFKDAESWLSWHCFRHAYASMGDRLGLTIAQRMRLMGHTDYSVTMGYTHLEFEEMREKLAALPRMIQ